MELRTKSKPRQREQERDAGKQLVLRDRVISSLGKVEHAPVEIQSQGEQETDAPVWR